MLTQEHQYLDYKKFENSFTIYFTVTSRITNLKKQKLKITSTNSVPPAFWKAKPYNQIIFKILTGDTESGTIYNSSSIHFHIKLLKLCIKQMEISGTKYNVIMISNKELK